MTSLPVLSPPLAHQLGPYWNDAVCRELPTLREAFDLDRMRTALDAGLGAGHGSVVRCHAPSATYMPGVGCTLRYRIELAGAETREPTVVTARLFPSDRSATRYFVARLAPLATRVAGRTPGGSLPASAAVLHELSMTAALFPLDGDLPTLVDAADPTIVSALLRRDASAPHRLIDVRLGHYGRGRRCVLRYLVSEPGACSRELIGKVVADGTAANAHLVLRALTADGHENKTRSLRVPATLGYHHHLRLLLLESVSGTALCSARVKSHLRGDQPQPRQAADEVATCARIAASLHRCSVDAGRQRAAEGDLRRLQRSAARIRAVSPQLGDRLLDRLHAVRERLSRSTPLSPGLCHGDFKLNQIVGEGRRRSLIDLDTACWAEPALDLGQFLAYLRLKAIDLGGTGLVDDLCGVFMHAYVESRGWPDGEIPWLEERTASYEALSLLSRAVHSWYKFKPERLHASLTLLDERLSCAPQ